MAESTIVPCFVCGNSLDCVGDMTPMQPYGGVMCRTQGNYGSRVLDSIRGEETVMFLVCDACLTERASRTRRVTVERVSPTTTYTEWPNGDNV